MVRVACHTRADYWRQQLRSGTVISLDRPTRDDEGDETDYGDTLADDHAIDLDKWLDDRAWLAGFPRRLVQIAHKRVAGIPLSKTDRQYLWRYRQQAQIGLK